MGNIPLAAVLFSHDVCFSGIMAFIFSDLVVLPVLRIQARYYGWKMALYILLIFLTVLVVNALTIQYIFFFLGSLPISSQVKVFSERIFFEVDITFWLNLFFICLSFIFLCWKVFFSEKKIFTSAEKLSEQFLVGLAVFPFVWLIGGLVVWSQLSS